MKKLIIISLLLLLVAGITGCIDNGKDTEVFFNNYIKAVDYHNEALDYRKLGNIYYDNFYSLYKDNYFNESIEQCEEARYFYELANQQHGLANTHFKITKGFMVEGYEDLVDAYINYGEITIKVNWLNYEACEYYESASYAFMNGDLEGGNSELDKGNDKTTAKSPFIKA